MAVIRDTVDGALERTADGFRHTRIFIVTGLSGAAEARLHNAYSASGVPQFGDAHPIIDGLEALEFSAVPLDSKTAQLTVVYRRPQVAAGDVGGDELADGLISVGTRVKAVSRTNDIFGNQIATTHRFLEFDAGGAIIRDETVTQPAEVDYLRPEMVLIATRIENRTPADKARLYVGKVNGSFFGGEAARSWLCTAIEGQSEDGGLTYTVTYEFERNSDSWDATVVFIDPDTDRPVAGSTFGNEIRQFRIYETANFNALGLPL